MKHLFTIHPEARQEVLDAIAYLERNREGYGDLFNLRVDEAIEKILTNPARYSLVKKDGIRRRILLDKPFHKSYCIYYDFDGEMIHIISIFHNRRSAKVWEERD